MVDEDGMNAKDYIDARVYVDARVADLSTQLNKRIDDKVHTDDYRYEEQLHATTLARTVQDRGLLEAIHSMDQHFTTVESKIDRLESHSGGAVPRGEIEGLFQGAETRTDSKIIEAMTQLRAQFSSEFSRLSDDISSLNVTVSALKDSIVIKQGQRVGMTITGRILVAVIASAAGIATLGSFLYAIFKK